MELVKWWRTARRERGITAAVGALGMTAFLLAAGLAIDISNLYLTGSELQNAADASAIAGASVLNGSASGVTAAVNAALATQNKYAFGGQVATFGRSDVRFGKNIGDLTNGNGYDETTARGMANDMRFIKVTVPNKAVAMNFAQLALGQNNMYVSRTAISGFAKGLQVLCDTIVPLCIVQDPATHAPLNPVGACPSTDTFTPARSPASSTARAATLP